MTADAVPVESGDPRRWLILGVMSGSMILVVVTLTALNVALPSIQRDLDASGSQLQWIIDSYVLVFAGFLLLAGSIGDHYGRRGALIVGLVVYGIAAGLTTFANDANQVIAGRALMGVGAALIMPATLSIIVGVFPANERTKAIAIWGAFAGVGGALGPILSGLLLEVFAWGSVFFINVPIAAAVIVLVIAIVPSSGQRDRSKLDAVGGLLSVLALSALVFGIIEGPERGWSDILVAGAFVVGALASAAFVLWELNTPHAMLDPRFFRLLPFSLGSLAITLSFLALAGVTFILILYFQFAQGHSPLSAGLRGLPLAAALMLAALLANRFVIRFGEWPTVAAGLFVTGAGALLLGFVDVDASYYVIAIALLLLGGGIGILTPPATAAIVSALPPEKAGVGSAVNDTTRELGTAIGIALLGTLLAVGYRSSMRDGLDGLSEPAAELAGDSIGAAMIVAQGLDGAVREAFVLNAQAAFSDGMAVAMFAAAAVSIGAGLAVLALGRKAGAEMPAVSDDSTRA